MKQIITRVEDDLAVSLKEQAARSGESVNAYVNRLLRVAVAGPEAPRQMWKAGAIAAGHLVGGRPRTGRARKWSMEFTTKLKGEASIGYASKLVRESRGDR